MRFFATGAYETICNACIPPEACADPEGLTAKFIGDRKHAFCLICQDFHEDTNEGVVDCDIDLHEHSPLARLCIERLAVIRAEKTKKSTPVSEPIAARKEAPASNKADASDTAREVQRDNVLIDLQIQINEMEKRLSLQVEKTLNLKILDLQKTLGFSEATPTSLDKSVQVDKQDLRNAEALYRAHKAKENPTQAILDSLPKIIETITNSIEKTYRFKTQNTNNSKISNNRDQEKVRKNRTKGPRQGSHNAPQNSNPRRK